MSLQRVLSIESMDRLPRSMSPAATERRKMSFNPIADFIPPKPVEQEPIIITQSVSVAKRVGTSGLGYTLHLKYVANPNTSSGRRSMCVLLACSRSRLWICGFETSLDITRRVSGLLPSRCA